MHALRTAATTIQRAVATAGARPLVKVLGRRTGIAASVIITTHNRATYLALTLAALERQLFSADAWEVLVVDDASYDDTATVLEKYQQRQRLQLTAQRLVRPRGALGARNDALELARGQVIVFLDDDQLVEPDFLLRHMVHHANEACVVLGDRHRRIHTHLFCPISSWPEGTSPKPIFEAEELLDDAKRRGSLIFAGEADYRPMFQDFHQRGVPHPFAWAYFNTGNASAPREQIMAAGGFDEQFRGHYLGDEELAYRLHVAGLTFRFEPQAHTLHQFHPRKLSRQADAAYSLRHFFYKHSDLDPAQIEPILMRKPLISAS